jgi:hypothetical protein
METIQAFIGQFGLLAQTIGDHRKVIECGSMGGNVMGSTRDGQLGRVASAWPAWTRSVGMASLDA